MNPTPAQQPKYKCRQQLNLKKNKPELLNESNPSTTTEVQAETAVDIDDAQPGLLSRLCSAISYPCPCCPFDICSKETEPKGDKKKVFKWYDAPLQAALACLYIVDVVTDIQLAVTFLQAGDYIYGGLTLAFVMLAYVVNLAMAVDDCRQRNMSYKGKVVRLLFTNLTLRPVVG